MDNTENYSWKLTVGKKSKNCQCCIQSYEPYKIGAESEIFFEQCVIPLADEDGKIIPPQGLCPFCNPKSIMWFTLKMKCHYDNPQTQKTQTTI